MVPSHLFAEHIFFELTRPGAIGRITSWPSRGTINTGHGCFGSFSLSNFKPYLKKGYSEPPSFERFQDPTIDEKPVACIYSKKRTLKPPILIAAAIMRHGSPPAAAFRRRGRRGGGLRSNGATPTTAAATAADGGRFAQALATHQALQSCRSWGVEMERMDLMR